MVDKRNFESPRNRMAPPATIEIVRSMSPTLIARGELERDRAAHALERSITLSSENYEKCRDRVWGKLFLIRSRICHVKARPRFNYLRWMSSATTRPVSTPAPKQIAVDSAG